MHTLDEMSEWYYLLTILSIQSLRCIPQAHIQSHYQFIICIFLCVRVYLSSNFPQRDKRQGGADI